MEILGKIYLITLVFNIGFFVGRTYKTDVLKGQGLFQIIFAFIILSTSGPLGTIYALSGSLRKP